MEGSNFIRALVTAEQAEKHNRCDYCLASLLILGPEVSTSVSSELKAEVCRSLHTAHSHRAAVTRKLHLEMLRRFSCQVCVNRKWPSHFLLAKLELCFVCVSVCVFDTIQATMLSG